MMGRRISFRACPQGPKHLRNICLDDEDLKRALLSFLGQGHCQHFGGAQHKSCSNEHRPFHASLLSATVLAGKERGGILSRPGLKWAVKRGRALDKHASPALTPQHSPAWFSGAAECFVHLWDRSFPFLTGRTALLCVGSCWFLFSFHPSSGCSSFSQEALPVNHLVEESSFRCFQIKGIRNTASELMMSCQLHQRVYESWLLRLIK